MPANYGPPDGSSQVDSAMRKKGDAVTNVAKESSATQIDMSAESSGLAKPVADQDAYPPSVLSSFSCETAGPCPAERLTLTSTPGRSREDSMCTYDDNDDSGSGSASKLRSISENSVVEVAQSPRIARIGDDDIDEQHVCLLSKELLDELDRDEPSERPGRSNGPSPAVGLSAPSDRPSLMLFGSPPPVGDGVQRASSEGLRASAPWTWKPDAPQGAPDHSAGAPGSLEGLLARGCPFGPITTAWSTSVGPSSMHAPPPFLTPADAPPPPFVNPADAPPPFVNPADAPPPFLHSADAPLPLQTSADIPSIAAPPGLQDTTESQRCAQVRLYYEWILQARAGQLEELRRRMSQLEIELAMSSTQFEEERRELMRQIAHYSETMARYRIPVEELDDPCFNVSDDQPAQGSASSNSAEAEPSALSRREPP